MLHVALSEVSAMRCFENFHFFACLVWSQTFMKLFIFPSAFYSYYENIFPLYFEIFVEETPQAQNGSTCAKAHDTKCRSNISANHCFNLPEL